MEAKSRLEEIRERVNQATQAPWTKVATCKVLQKLGSTHSRIHRKRPLELFSVFAGDHALEPSGTAQMLIVEEDADFIAHAREDVPWLLKQVEFWRRVAELCASTMCPPHKTCKSDCLRCQTEAVAAELEIELGEVE